MKFDKVKVGKVISDIEKYSIDLEGIKLKGQKSISKIEFYGASMLIFSIVNSYIDLANEIISSNSFGYPSTYSDMFDLLQQRNIINESESKAFKRLVNIRNVIAHRYFNITQVDIINAISDLKKVKKLISIFK
ncbi:MAG: type VII toxin-antitoxin system HepT family RNase toxin [Candidatus Parvarchaeum sp.]